MSKKRHSDETIAAHAGRKPQENHGFVNPPVYHGSTIIFNSYEDFKKGEEGTFEGITYARHGSPSQRLFEEAIAELEGADKALITNSGAAAVAVTLAALLKPGDHILIADSVYSPTRFYANQELARIGVEVTYYDPQADIKNLLQKNTKVVFAESPGSLTFEIQDIPALVRHAHAAGAVVVIDNTWATPLFFKAFEHGVDVSIHSATKYIGGHSDLMMGIINCTDKIYPTLKRAYKNFGVSVGPDNLYLAQRGLRTLPVRLKHQADSGLKIAKWLQSQSAVSRVLHPALPDYPGHEIWKRDYKWASGLFTFILKSKLSEKDLSARLAKLKFFKLGYSWGGYESLIIPVNAEKIRTATKWQPEGTAFRISIGLENVDELIEDLSSLL